MKEEIQKTIQKISTINQINYTKRKKDNKDILKKKQTRKLPSTNYEENIDKDKCVHDHTDYEMSYNQESNVHYLKEGASMNGIHCRGCNSSFYDNSK